MKWGVRERRKKKGRTFCRKDLPDLQLTPQEILSFLSHKKHLVSFMDLFLLFKYFFSIRPKI